MMGIIVNKHQRYYFTILFQYKSAILFNESFIEKLISDKNQLSLKCEEYLYELKQNQPKDYSFQTEMETLKKLSSNEETQSAYMKVIFFNLQKKIKNI